MKLPPIDYARISRAIDWYVSAGYTYIEVPWYTSREIATALMPPDKVRNRPYQLPDDMELVGSGEVALVGMLSRGALTPETFYVTCTPCFRWEPDCSVTHLPQFLKVELFHSGPWDASSRILEEAERFLSDESIGLSGTVKTSEGHDINIHGIEVGSYGYRYRGYQSLSWSYGTGLAEPRTSYALQQGDKS
tara:strand:+ start:31898 stop:32470 length:573 start_codon:yes stop_codon:yes gene_type:complete